MVAANYMTIADTQSIWATTLDATRFAYIGVRMAEMLNFKLYHAATTQCANAAVTPLLEQFSEEALIELIAAAKIEAVDNPWDFIQANVTRVVVRKLNEWSDLIEEIKLVLSRKYYVQYSSKLDLPSHADDE